MNIKTNALSCSKQSIPILDTCYVFSVGSFYTTDWQLKLIWLQVQASVVLDFLVEEVSLHAPLSGDIGNLIKDSGQLNKFVSTLNDCSNKWRLARSTCRRTFCECWKFCKFLDKNETLSVIFFGHVLSGHQAYIIATSMLFMPKTKQAIKHFKEKKY